MKGWSELLDLSELRGWFPKGTKLTVMDVADNGRIYVRWKLPGEPGFVNEAVLQIAMPRAREKALADDAHD